MNRALFVVHGRDLRDPVRRRMVDVYSHLVVDLGTVEADALPGKTVMAYFNASKEAWYGPNNPRWNEVRRMMETHLAEGVRDPKYPNVQMYWPSTDAAEEIAARLYVLYRREWGYDAIYLDDLWGVVPDRLRGDEVETYCRRWPYFRNYLLSQLCESGLKVWANVGTPLPLHCVETFGNLRGICIEYPQVEDYGWWAGSRLPENIGWYSQGTVPGLVMQGDVWGHPEDGA